MDGYLGGVATARDFPVEWARQYERLGLAP
jgi:hypothetical protein